VARLADPEVQKAVAGVTGQLRAAMAKSLNRTVDAFRHFDADASGMIDAREFRKALHQLGVVAPKAAMNAAFASLDVDMSGAVDYHELDARLRRTTADPSHLARIARLSIPVREVSSDHNHRVRMAAPEDGTVDDDALPKLIHAHASCTSARLSSSAIKSHQAPSSCTSAREAPRQRQRAPAIPNSAR